MRWTRRACAILVAGVLPLSACTNEREEPEPPPVTNDSLGDWEDTGRYAACELLTTTAMACGDRESFNLTGCDAGSLASVPADGIYTMVYRNDGTATPSIGVGSFLVSADMAHALHPNYASMHEPKHAPVLGGGPVIKSNVNQSYATDGETAAWFALCCREVGVTPQNLVTRTDLGCGSTIGPISAGELGIRTVDVGNPMMSMHSIREMAAAADVAAMISVLHNVYVR